MRLPPSLSRSSLAEFVPFTLLFFIKNFETVPSSEMKRVKIHQCSGCLKSGPGMLCCSICRYAHYCSPACQKSDWPGHKKICKETAADYPFLKTFPRAYPDLFDHVGAIAHIYARKQNVSSVCVNLDYTEGVVFVEMNNVSFAEVVEETRSTPDGAALIESMIEAHHCLDPYQGVAHLIISYKNLTCSFRTEFGGQIAEEKQKLIEASNFAIVGGKKENHFIYLITGNNKETITL